jgi:hypothetical protein
VFGVDTKHGDNRYWVLDFRNNISDRNVISKLIDNQKLIVLDSSHKQASAAIIKKLWCLICFVSIKNDNK